MSEEMTPKADSLPELPKTPIKMLSDLQSGTVDVWPEHLVRAYGQQCYEAGVAAERERQATECERLASLLSGPNESDGEYAMWMNRAAAIRNG